MSLDEYRAKRQLDHTPEPTGGQGSGPLRFVVQMHQASHLHYDFRLEMGGILRSWAVPKGPSLNPENKHLAMMTEDHPYDYRTFEGIIPEGNYGAGSVIVWDEGTYEPLGATGDRSTDDKHARQGVHKGHLTFILHGQKLNGEFALIKMHKSEENAWLLVKADKDRFVSQDDVTKQNQSVITGRTVEQVAQDAPVTELHLEELASAPVAPMPDDPKPMLATLTGQPFDDPAWIYEVKWDGYRIMASLQSDSVQLHSRSGQDYTAQFQPIADELRTLQVPATIDGEVVVVDDSGRSSFQALQQFLQTQQGRLVYYAFDLVHLDGRDLSSLPLIERKAILRRILPSGEHLKYSDHIEEQGTALLGSARAQGLEGIIAKRAGSQYTSGSRSRDWLKLKLHRRQEAIIIGYTEPRAGRQYFGALVLGIYDDNHRLIYAGHTGTGFTEEALQTIHKSLQDLTVEQSPVQPEPKTNEPAHWVRPELVCEVQFTEWTADGSMRHPVFIGLRQDKPASDITREQAIPARAAGTSNLRTDEVALPLDGHAVKITHANKTFWPHEQISKGDLIDYYRAAAGTLLPYLRDRPESLRRFPDGITGESFYHKDLSHAPDWAQTIRIHSDSEDRDLNYLLCQDEATLIYMINLGCIDLNPWNSRISALDKPDWCVIDLDPEAIGFEAVVQTAQAVHAVLTELKLPGYPKTSGATGMHIYIPLGAQYTYDQVKLFAELIVRLVHARVPDITSLERSPAKRQGKVYLDYFQNRRGQTLAAPYSVRPQAGATVSAPLDWSEVALDLRPAQFTIHNMHERFALDKKLWRPVIGSGIDLAAIIK